MANLARIDVTSGEIQLEASTPGVGRGGFASFLAEVEQAPDKRSVVDAFLERQTSFPIIEGPDRVHFVYRGEADDIGIVGDMIGSRREEPMVRVEGTDLYYFSSRLERDASINYGFIKDFGDEPSPDPLNPSAGDGVFGEVSWFAMPAWQPPTFLAEAAPARQGRFETVEWESEAREGQKRTAQVYLPAGFDAGSDRRYPSAYFFAGKEALEDGGLKNVLDNLVGETVEPLIAIFVMPDEENSRGDLRRIDPYCAMVVSELVPMIDEKYPTIPDARARGAIGMGRAGAGALYTALKHSDVFRGVGSQGAFMPLHSETPLPEMVRTADDQPLTIYMGWGTYQWRSPHEAWDTAQDNRELWELLRKRGFTPTGGEFPDGSGWSCWRSRTGELLGTLFPIPRDPA